MSSEREAGVGHDWISCHDCGPKHDPGSERAVVCGRCGGSYVIGARISPPPPCRPRTAPVEAAGEGEVEQFLRINADKKLQEVERAIKDLRAVVDAGKPGGFFAPRTHTSREPEPVGFEVLPCPNTLSGVHGRMDWVEGSERYECASCGYGARFVRIRVPIPSPDRLNSESSE